MKHEFQGIAVEVIDAATLITKLKRSLKNARTRAKHWRDRAKAIDHDWERLAAQQNRIILQQRSRIDQLRMEREEAQAYNSVLQWRINSMMRCTDPQASQVAAPPPNPHNLQALQAMQANAQYSQAVQQAAMLNAQNQQMDAQDQQLNQQIQREYHNIIGSQLNSPFDWCNCVPARHDMLIPPR